MGKLLIGFLFLISSCATSTVLAVPPKQDTGATTTITGIITPETADRLFLFINALPPTVKILDVKIDSPGGHTPASQLISTMFEYASNRGLVIRCTVDGLAASAAAFILEACTVRRMHLGSTLLFHEPFILIPPSGEPTKISLRTLHQLDLDLTENTRFFAEHVAKRLRISIDTYVENVKGKNWVLTATEAFTNHAIDEVIP